mmetsp:Transcript_25614/g.71771  ORF Transcript_25614/g.71771 Transcript_25614/m.71771 type:complete len:205 (+) Transcript_25614:121-735(+)
MVRAVTAGATAGAAEAGAAVVVVAAAEGSDDLGGGSGCEDDLDEAGAREAAILAPTQRARNSRAARERSTSLRTSLRPSPAASSSWRVSARQRMKLATERSRVVVRSCSRRWMRDNTSGSRPPTYRSSCCTRCSSSRRSVPSHRSRSPRTEAARCRDFSPPFCRRPRSACSRPCRSSAFALPAESSLILCLAATVSANFPFWDP